MVVRVAISKQHFHFKSCSNLTPSAFNLQVHYSHVLVGAIFVLALSQSSVEDTVFRQNEADFAGGAISIGNFDELLEFSSKYCMMKHVNHLARHSSYVTTTTVISMTCSCTAISFWFHILCAQCRLPVNRCLFFNNTALVFAGALRVSGLVSTHVNNTDFLRNACYGPGGAISLVSFVYACSAL